MAGKYLKARQLAKEIEKKAKKTAEKKKKAKEGLKKAEELLGVSEELGISVSDTKEIIEKARENFENKDFEDASEMVDEGLDTLQNSYLEKLDEIIEKIENIHDYLDEDMENSEHEDMVKEARELFDKEMYKDSINKAEQTLLHTKKAMEEIFEDRLYSLESKLETLQTLNGDIDEFKAELSLAENYLDESNIEKAKQSMDSFEGKIDDEIRTKINDKIEEIERIERLLRDNGISTEGAEETVSQVKAKSKKGEFSDVVDLFGKTERELSDRKDELVSKMVDKLRDGIEEARELGAPQKKIKEINDKIDDLQGKQDFGSIISIIDELFEKLEEAKFHRVLKTIAESRENFIKAKEIGIDISEPMTILNEARNALKKGNHKEALEWAKKGRKKVRDMVKEHEKTEKAIEKIKELKDGLAKFEIDLSIIDDKIIEAEGYLEQKEYSQSREVVKEIEEDIDKRSYEKIMELIEEFEVNILTLERMDLESDEYTEMLEEAIANTKTMDYLKAGKIAIEGKNEVIDRIEEELNFKIESVSDIVSNIQEVMDTKDIKDDLENVEDILQQAKEEKENTNYKTSFDMLKEAENTVNEWQVGEADQKYNEAMETIALLEGIDLEGIDLEEYKNKLDEAGKEIDQRNYPIGIKKTEEVLDDLNIKLKEKSEQFFSNAKVEVVKAKKSGVDINKMREELIECKKNIKQENYTKAIRLSLDVEERAKKIRDERVEIKTLLTDINKKIKKIMDQEQVDSEDLKTMNTLFKEAKNSFQNRNYTEAKELANKTKVNIEDLKKKNEFEDYFERYNGLLKRAEVLSVDTEDIQDKENKILNEAEENNYDSAIQMIQQVNEEVLKEIKISVQPRLEHTQEIIESAKEIGIDISAQEELLSEAIDDFEDDEFQGAVEKIIECQNQIQEIRDKSKKAARIVKEAKNRLEESMDLHADVSTAKKELQVAMGAIKNDEYEKAIGNAEKALSSVRLAEKNRVEKILSTFKEKINEMRLEGMNTSLADNLIARAEKAKKNENYKEAINLAMQSEGELERIELQQDIAKRSISTTTDKLTKAEDEGINVSKPEEILQDAKSAYDGGFYVKAFDKAVKGGEILNNVIKAFNESKNILDEVKKVIEKTEELGMEEKELHDKYSKAIKAFENDNYEKSYSLANRAKERLSDLKKDLPDYISDMEEVVNNLKSKGSDVGESEKLINKANANLKMGNIIEVFDLLGKAKEEYGGKYLEEYEKYISEASKLVEKASKFGTDVSETRAIIEEARKLKDDDIKKANDKAKKALNEIENRLAPYSPRIELEIDNKLRLDKWNKVQILVKNTGGGVAKSPSLEIEGAEHKDLELPSMLKANENFEVESKIKPIQDKVVIKGIGTRIFDNKDIIYELEVDVNEGEFKIINATGEEKCGICKGKIKKGLDVIICDCGSTYHKLCGERKGECPDCGLEFTLEEKEKKTKEDKKASKRVALRI
ncbi:MAG: RING finger protein [Thermoplasmatota archaeon]